MNTIDIGLIFGFTLSAIALFLSLRKEPIAIISNFGIKLPDAVLCSGCEIIYSHHYDICPYCGEKEKYKLSNNIHPLFESVKEVKHGLSDDQRDAVKSPIMDRRTAAAKHYMGYIVLDHFYPFPNWSFAIPVKKSVVIGADPEVLKPSWTVALYNQCGKLKESFGRVFKRSHGTHAGYASSVGKDTRQGRDYSSQR